MCFARRIDERSARSASSPPAEAPTPTMERGAVGGGASIFGGRRGGGDGVVAAGRRAGRVRVAAALTVRGVEPRRRGALPLWAPALLDWRGCSPPERRRVSSFLRDIVLHP